MAQYVRSGRTCGYTYSLRMRFCASFSAMSDYSWFTMFIFPVLARAFYTDNGGTRDSASTALLNVDQDITYAIERFL